MASGCTARPPNSLRARPDLERLLRTVEPRTTPVVIAERLQWVQPDQLTPLRQQFHRTLQEWQQAKTGGQLEALMRFYTPDFQGLRKATLADWRRQLQAELPRQQGRELQLKDLSWWSRLAKCPKARAAAQSSANTGATKAHRGGKFSLRA